MVVSFTLDLRTSEDTVSVSVSLPELFCTHPAKDTKIPEELSEMNWRWCVRMREIKVCKCIWKYWSLDNSVEHASLIMIRISVGHYNPS